MSTRSLIAVFFVMATALALASATGRGQEPAAAPKPQKSHYTLSVTVVTTKASEPESVVKGADVTVFYARDSQQSKRTGSDGKVSFEFDTEDTSVIVRVLADRMNVAQPLVPLVKGRTECKIPLTKSQ